MKQRRQHKDSCDTSATSARSFNRSGAVPLARRSPNTSSSAKNNSNHVDLSNRDISALDLTALGGCNSQERNMLSALTSMSLASNSLRELPRELSQLLPRLSVLDVCRNLLSSSVLFPRSLTVLDVSSNQLPSITDLVSLTQLRKLDISDNRVMSFGVLRRIVDPFPHLVELRAASNWVKSLRGIECVPSIEVIDVSHNAISFPEDLAPLDALPRLRQALLHGNPVAGTPNNLSSCGSSIAPEREQREEQDAFQDEEEEEYNDDDAEEEQQQQQLEENEQWVEQQQQQQRRHEPTRKQQQQSRRQDTSTTTASSSSAAAPAVTAKSRTTVSSYAAAFRAEQQQRSRSPEQQQEAEQEDVDPQPEHSHQEAVSSSMASPSEVLLDFERKANHEIRGEVRGLSQQLREARHAAANSAQSARALKKENDELRAKVAELEEQKERDRVERTALKQRFDDKVRRLVDEHQRVAVAQEAEIQELRLELEALSRRRRAVSPVNKQKQQQQQQQSFSEADLLAAATDMSPPNYNDDVDEHGAEGNVPALRQGFQDQLKNWVAAEVKNAKS